MPGPVSDSYDPEWGTAATGSEILDALNKVYDRLTEVLGGKPPMYIVELVRGDLPAPIVATLSEKQWRLLRFALERARESI